MDELLDDETRSEIKRFQGEYNASMDNLDNGKTNFARSLLNGLGDEMMKTLDNPPPPPKKHIFRNLLRRISDLF